MTYGLLEKYDVIDWAGWMKRAGCRNLYGLGESLGASILIEAAAVEPVTFSAIVAESPFADLRETAEYRVRRMSMTTIKLPGFVAIPLAKAVVSSAVLYARWVDGSRPPSGLTSQRHRARIDSHSTDTRPAGRSHSPLEFSKTCERKSAKFPLARTQRRAHRRGGCSARRVPPAWVIELVSQTLVD